MSYKFKQAMIALGFEPEANNQSLNLYDGRMTMRTHNIATATRPNGCFGDTITVYLVYDNGQLLEVHPYGYHKSPALPCDFVDHSEASWHLENHPGAKGFYTDIRFV